MTIVPLRNPQEDPVDNTLERLVSLTTKNNLVALNKTLAAIECSNKSHAVAASRLSSYAERMHHAVLEIKTCL